MLQFAITKKPGKRFSEGITTANLGIPDLPLALQQHQNYVRALKACGLEVIELEADDAFPDSCFAEDPAVILDKVAVITNPGADSRKGEIVAIASILEKYRPLVYLKAPGTLEGGDVLEVKNHFYIGNTDRTNKAGAKQLGEILSKFRYTSSTIEVKSVLHLKTGVNYIGRNNLVATHEFASHPEFKDFNIVEIEENETYAANCLYINGKLIIPNGFKNVQSKLLSLNYDIIGLDMSEFEKMDGGLTCLSLRF